MLCRDYLPVLVGCGIDEIPILCLDNGVAVNVVKSVVKFVARCETM